VKRENTDKDFIPRFLLIFPFPVNYAPVGFRDFSGYPHPSGNGGSGVLAVFFENRMAHGYLCVTRISENRKWVFPFLEARIKNRKAVFY